MTTTHDIVAKLWNLCHVLRDDGITYHQYVSELTYLLFLKMAEETETEHQLPEGYRWRDLHGARCRRPDPLPPGARPAVSLAGIGPRSPRGPRPGLVGEERAVPVGDRRHSCARDTEKAPITPHHGRLEGDESSSRPQTSAAGPSCGPQGYPCGHADLA